MAGNADLTNLIEDAVDSGLLRRRFAQDRTAPELVESARKEGYNISDRDARKILAGAYLTSDRVDSDVRNRIAGGLSWDYLKKVESELDGQYSFLDDRDAWKRARDFYEYVFQEGEE